VKGTVEHSLQAGTGLHLGHAGGPSSQRHDELVQRFVCQDGLMTSRRHCDRGAAGPRVVFRLASGSERITTFRRGRRDDRQFVCRASGCSGHSASSGSSQSAPKSGKTIANTAASKQATVSALADLPTRYWSADIPRSRPRSKVLGTGSPCRNVSKVNFSNVAEP